MEIKRISKQIVTFPIILFQTYILKFHDHSISYSIIKKYINTKQSNQRNNIKTKIQKTRLSHETRRHK